VARPSDYIHAFLVGAGIGAAAALLLAIVVSTIPANRPEGTGPELLVVFFGVPLFALLGGIAGIIRAGTKPPQ
jgi:hypothetical protein